ncbi:hypothetical protein A0H76_3061 [Hepatospora eriocheir]|uniref:Uncharacterized protein n=1 Tax=Hepatospora eriocheir TaxID=1081669 RepID=A0A1X0QBM3_9MICR|nr:hypothetical protein A0H76_3061 [Hepatospora eriocheir]ORD97181.1 hypothetical protein HERIO_2761 [Hepatospora eriocheir]
MLSTACCFLITLSILPSSNCISFNNSLICSLFI